VIVDAQPDLPQKPKEDCTVDKTALTIHFTSIPSLVQKELSSIAIKALTA
jgi:hypothetical protein